MGNEREVRTMLFKDLKEGQHFRLGPTIGEKRELQTWPLRTLFPESLQAMLDADPGLTPETLMSVNARTVAPKKWGVLLIADDTDVVAIPLEHTLARAAAAEAYKAELVARMLVKQRK